MKFLIFSIFIISYDAFSFFCPENKYPVEGYFRDEYYRTSGTHVNSSYVSPYCREYRKSNILKPKFNNYKYKKWPHKNERFRAWSELDKKEVMIAFEQMPESIKKIGQINFYRADRSIFDQNPASALDEQNIITFYDLAFKLNLKEILYHELAHLFFQNLSQNEKNEFYSLAGWEGNSKIGFKTKKMSFIKQDSKIGPEEDFANYLEIFLFDPKKLNYEINIQKFFNKLVKL